MAMQAMDTTSDIKIWVYFHDHIENPKTAAIKRELLLRLLLE